MENEMTNVEMIVEETKKSLLTKDHFIGGAMVLAVEGLAFGLMKAIPAAKNLLAKKEKNAEEETAEEVIVNVEEETIIQ